MQIITSLKEEFTAPVAGNTTGITHEMEGGHAETETPFSIHLLTLVFIGFFL